MGPGHVFLFNMQMGKLITSNYERKQPFSSFSLQPFTKKEKHNVLSI